MSIGEGSVLKDNIVLERELGRGAMGVVWLARNRALDSEVCVKVLRADGEEPDLRERFLREAKAVARIDHPHVVRIFDYGVSADGAPFFVMERLRGQDLYARIGAEGPLSVEDAVSVMDQAASALGRAHELGVVHRDIKPANVFLLEGAGRVFVKLLDFGIAKVATADDLGLTQTASLLGTPYYMSPEQFIDPRNVDHRTDLWSLTVVAYACLVGQLPFLGASVGALSLAVHKGDYVPPTSVDPSLPGSLDAWFRRALDPDPERRFGSAGGLAESFAEAARGRSSSPDALAETAASRDSSAATSADPRPEAPASETASHPTPSEGAGETDEAVVESASDDDAPAGAEAPEEGSLHEERAPAAASAKTAAELRVVPILESSVGPVTSTHSGAGRPAANRGKIAAAIGAAVAVAAIAALWLREPDATPAPAETAAADEREVRVQIDPPDAAVRVNGVARPAPEGFVSLRGQPGESFVVELSAGDDAMQRTVFITRDGVPSVDRLVLPKAPPKTEAPPDPEPTAPDPETPPKSQASPAPKTGVAKPTPLPKPAGEAPPPPPDPVAPPSRESWD